jgi:hypothetical protein
VKRAWNVHAWKRSPHVSASQSENRKSTHKWEDNIKASLKKNVGVGIAQPVYAVETLGRATRHVLTLVAKCIDVGGGIFENVLYYVNCTNFVT